MWLCVGAPAERLVTQPVIDAFTSALRCKDATVHGNLALVIAHIAQESTRLLVRDRRTGRNVCAGVFNRLSLLCVDVRGWTWMTGKWFRLYATRSELTHLATLATAGLVPPQIARMMAACAPQRTPNSPCSES